VILRDVRLVDGRGRVDDEAAIRFDAAGGGGDGGSSGSGDGDGGGSGRNEITAVGDAEPRADETVRSLPGHTVLPGLVDAHVHFSLSGETSVETAARKREVELALTEARNARRTLEGGVTSARVMGARDVDPVVRNAIEAGWVRGPRVRASGRSITITGGHGYHMGREADGVEDCRRAVREQAKRGADFIKFMATGGVTTAGSDPGATAFTREEMAALAHEAHRRGLPVATHAHGAAGIKAAVRAGVDTVEHGTFLDDEALDLLLDRDVALVPTLSAAHHIVRNAERATADSRAKSVATHERHVESFRRAHEAGVRIAAGTDAGTPFNDHGANSTEIEFMVEHGMSAKEAIAAMTEASAAAIGFEDAGRLDPGLRADLLVVEGDPLEKVTTISDPVCVIQGGAVVSGRLPRDDG